MKAIILAAGKGTRLQKYTRNLPKCMLEFDGKTLIGRQVETLRACGIKDIVVVKGYMAEKIKISGVKNYINEDYDTTNMVHTLFCAEEEMHGDILVCYSDIVYEKRVIRKILKSDSDIGVTVDSDYWEYWTRRMDDPRSDIESMKIKDGKIIELGTPNCSPEDAKERYVGLIKFSAKGIEALKKTYHENKKKYFDKNEKWMNSRSFQQGYMTCMLNAIIKSGHEVNPISITRGWLEFDTNEDYEKYTQWLKEGSLNSFYNSSE